MANKENKNKRPMKQSGFTLLEIIIVVALIAFVYTSAMPNLSMVTSAALATKMARMGTDVRSAFDLSVLTNKTYRMVFMLAKGEYWLEVTNAPNIKIGGELLDRDPSEEEEKEQKIEFEQQFEEYLDLAGETVIDPKSDKEIKPSSPVIKAKRYLQEPSWSKVKTIEWGVRSLGDMIIKDMSVEHLASKVSFDADEDRTRAFIYFSPSGYVEKAVLHIYFKEDKMVVDEDQEPFTVITEPREGTARVISGYEEVNVHKDD